MRPAIIKLHEKGYSTREIEQLDVSQSSVTRHIKRFEETGSHKDRKGRGRKKTTRSEKNIQHSKGMIRRNPKILMEKACQKPHPNVESLKRALKKA